MNIILVSNAPTVDICEKIQIKSSPKEGWVMGLLNSLRNSNVNIYFIFPHRVSKEIIKGTVDGIKYYGFPKTRDKDWKYEEIHKEYFCKIFQEIGEIDVIHIMGTEMGHTLSAVEAAEQQRLIDKIVISIQGLTSVYATHYFSNLPSDIVYSNTIRDFIKKDNIYNGRQVYIKRGDYEVKALKKVHHVIGRTDWDMACTYLINPKAKYHFCNETLREQFYSGKWSYENCEKLTIFMSQGGYPIKGMHYAIEAMSYIKRFYPNVKLRITGNSPLTHSLINRQKRNSYQNYIERLIVTNNLEENIEFLGVLNADDMKREYLRANVFISPSTIENSPNSLGEAMILGTPAVASDVGGVKNLMEHNKEGFIYPSDEPYMLAYYVLKIFESQNLASKLSENAREHALVTHSYVKNGNAILSIYNNIANRNDYNEKL